MTAWWPVEWPPVGTTVTLGHDLVLTVDPALLAPGLDEPQLGLDVRRDEPRVVAEGDLPLGLLGDDLRVRERRSPSARSSPPAWSKWRWLIATDVDALGQEPGGLEGRRRSTAPRSRASSRVLSSTRSPMPVSTRTRPDCVSISRQLSAWRSRRLSSTSSSTRPFHRTHGTGPNSVPASDRNVPAWTSATRDAAAEVASTSRPRRSSPSGYFRVGSPVARPASKSRWNADAVGSDWPWYFDPSSGEPYGRSTGLDILKKLIWPIRIPK